MVSEDVFHQRGLTLLYRTSNLIIQSLCYGELLISTLYSSSYVLRYLCVAYPDFDIYNDVSYLISLKKSQELNLSDQCKARRACAR